MENNKTVELIKIKGVEINKIKVAVAFITNIEIYESLTQPGITGYMDIKDYQALQELGNVFADDEVKICFGVDNDEANELDLTFKIFTNEGSKQLALNTYDHLRIGFCSPWLIDGLTRLVSKPYQDKLVSEIVQDLLEECGAEIGYIEPTKTKLENFVSPLWTPYHTIKHLLNFAINNSKVGGYLCWTDLRTGKVNVTTIDYLTKGSLGTFATPGFIVNPANLRYHGRVMNMSIESSYDTIRTVNTGLPQIKYQTFNFDTSKVVSTTSSLAKDKQTRLGKKFPLRSKYTDKKYMTTKFTSLFPETADSITFNESKLSDLLNGLESNHYAMLSTDILKINIDTLGETKRRVGWLAELDYPSVAQDTGAIGNKTSNKQLKGLYLIREIKHEFSLHSDYYQYITLVSDGYFESPLDLIKWD